MKLFVEEPKAEVLGRHVVGSDINGEVVRLYECALREIGSEAMGRDAAILPFVARAPWSLPYLDAALALVDPRSGLRRRVIAMTAILETCPAYADRFLPRERPALYGVNVCCKLLRAVFNAALGLVLLWFLR